MLIRLRPARGSALAILLLVLALLLVFLVAVVAIGARHSRMIQANLGSVAAVQSAEAGIHAALNQISADTGWSAGFTDVALGGEQDQAYSVEVTNNSSGATAVNGPGGVSVPAGMIYLLSTGTSQNASFSRQVAVFLEGQPAGYNYTISSGGTVEMGAAGVVYGTVKSNGDLILSARVSIEPVDGEGHLLTSGNLTVQAQLNMGPGQEVRARGSITGENKIQDAAQIVANDTTAATEPFIADGRLTNDPPAGREVMPNPDPATLLSGAVTHNETLYDGTDLDGKVHYYPNGVTFKNPPVGTGTIVVGNANSAIFDTVLNHKLNIVVLDGQNGTVGGGRIEFNRATTLEGLVFCQGSIYSNAAFTLVGRAIAYGDGEFVHSGARITTTLQQEPVPGFEAFFGGGAGGGTLNVASWQRL